MLFTHSCIRFVGKESGYIDLSAFNKKYVYFIASLLSFLWIRAYKHKSHYVCACLWEIMLHGTTPFLFICFISFCSHINTKHTNTPCRHTWRTEFVFVIVDCSPLLLSLLFQSVVLFINIFKSKKWFSISFRFVSFDLHNAFIFNSYGCMSFLFRYFDLLDYDAKHSTFISQLFQLNKWFRTQSKLFHHTDETATFNVVLLWLVLLKLAPVWV